MKRRVLLVPALVVVAAMIGLLFVAFSIGQDSNVFSMSGTLESGVEAGCTILAADDGAQYLLLGWSNYPPTGTRVTVTGYFENNVASYCMQGKAAIQVLSLSVSATTMTSISYATGTATAGTATLISGSTAQATTITGVSTTVSGYVYSVVESPNCYPQCGAPSFILTYLYVPPGTGCTGSMGCYPPPQYYRLLDSDGTFFQTTAPNGTYATVTGMLVMPSSWDCDSLYVPRICMLGDIYVHNVAYRSPSQSTSASSTTAITETITRIVPIPGFELPSIVMGVFVGLAIVAATRSRVISAQEISNIGIPDGL